MARDTRQRMVATTGKLLQRQGFHGTGLTQVLADAGAPKGSLYFHFPGGKEQLAAEAIVASAAVVDGALDSHRRTDALASLDAYLLDVAGLLERTAYSDGCPIATVALEVAATAPEIGDACASAFDRLIGRVALWIEADGVAPMQARPRAELVYAAIEGAILFAKARRSVEPIHQLRAQLPFLLR
jgi:TetR/AcrR family transcriptional regulator, lmrAB and yxaGH operons repressor